MPDCIDEFRESGNQLSDCVNQQSDGDNLHGFSPHFVRLNWCDMSEVESREQDKTGKVAQRRGEG
jgi:hypothetical protein